MTQEHSATTRKPRETNKALRVAMAENDLTQAELADRAGLHRQTISRVYTGQFRLCRKSAERVARVLNSTPEALGLAQEEERGVE